MLKNYLQILLRKFYRERVYALVNLLGLSLALACALILILYIRSELTFDQHYIGHERVVRIVNTFTTDGEADHFSFTSIAVGPLFTQDYPDSGEFVRFQRLNETVLRNNEADLFWDDLYIVDDNIFNILSHDVIYGDLENGLVDPSSIVISESLSKNYFGNRNPIGETLSTDTFDYKISAVFRDLPDNSHLRYSALLSRNRLASFGQSDDRLTPRQLHGVGVYTYFKISEEITPVLLASQLNEFYENRAGDIARQINRRIQYFAQPLTGIHFDNQWDYDLPTGNIFYIYGFSAVTIFLLLVACINYTNLAIARATGRAKEVGMQKIIGANRSQLVMQFMGEALFLTVTAMGIGILIVMFVDKFTAISTLFDKTQLLDFARDPIVILWLFCLALAVGGLSGAYPAFYLSSISPLKALTATKNSGHSKFFVQRLLVFAQFLVSIAVVACTLLMFLQMQYVAEKSLGYDEENLISVRLRGVDVIEKLPLIRDELMKNPNVKGVAETTYVPGDLVSINGLFVENNEGALERPPSIHNIIVGKEFLEVMGIDVREGRDFSQRLLTDTGQSLLVNEALVRKMGWEEALGKRIGGQNQQGRVIGVVNNFHFMSLHQNVEPLLIRLFPPADFSNVPPLQRNTVSRPIVIKIAGEDFYGSINHIESVMNQFDATHPFEFKFFDSLLDQLYTSETNLMKLTGIFSGICILISCMGLFGLSSFTTEQRTKEIGIRKVLGASTPQILVLLARSQMILVVIAAVIASAISYFVMEDWLSTFAYRTNIQIWVFIVATLAVAGVAFFTIALQSSRTAQSNPVNALRYE